MEDTNNSGLHWALSTPPSDGGESNHKTIWAFFKKQNRAPSTVGRASPQSFHDTTGLANIKSVCNTPDLRGPQHQKVLEESLADGGAPTPSNPFAALDEASNVQQQQHLLHGSGVAGTARRVKTAVGEVVTPQRGGNSLSVPVGLNGVVSPTLGGSPNGVQLPPALVVAAQATGPTPPVAPSLKSDNIQFSNPNATAKQAGADLFLQMMNNNTNNNANNNSNNNMNGAGLKSDEITMSNQNGNAVGHQQLISIEQDYHHHHHHQHHHNNVGESDVQEVDAVGRGGAGRSSRFRNARYSGNNASNQYLDFQDGSSDVEFEMEDYYGDHTGGGRSYGKSSYGSGRSSGRGGKRQAAPRLSQGRPSAIEELDVSNLRPRFDVQFTKGIHLRLGESGRRTLKALVQNKMHTDGEFRQWVRMEYGRVKCMTIKKLLAVAHQAGLWDEAVALAQHFAHSKGAPILRADSGMDDEEGMHDHAPNGFEGGYGGMLPNHAGFPQAMNPMAMNPLLMNPMMYNPQNFQLLFQQAASNPALANMMSQMGHLAANPAAMAAGFAGPFGFPMAGFPAAPPQQQVPQQQVVEQSAGSTAAATVSDGGMGVNNNEMNNSNNTGNDGVSHPNPPGSDSVVVGGSGAGFTQQDGGHGLQVNMYHA